LHVGRVALAGSEAHHLAHVLRLRPGQLVTLFDGQGKTAEAVVVGVRRQDVDLDVQSVRQADRWESGVTVATAAPKANRLQWLVEKCTELGADRLIPVQWRRSVAGKGSEPDRLGKWRRWAIEACKQSRRPFVPEICETMRLNQLLASLNRYDLCLAGGVNSECVGFDQLAQRVRSAGRILLVVGPEGGFDDGELLAIKRSGATFVKLGRTVLRTETAATALLAATVAIRGS